MISDEDVITYDEAVGIYGQDTVEAALVHQRHHHDDDGRPYWIAAELVEAVGLVERERDQEEVDP
jgi:hypothetical protein